MKTKTRWTMLAAVGLVLGASPAPVVAASITAEDFVATARPTIDFLEISSRIALANSDSGRTRVFARGEIKDQTDARDSFVAWRQAERRAIASAAATPSIDGLGPIAGLATVPLSALASLSGSPGFPLAPLPSAARFRAAVQQDLARLSALRGSDFDALYLSTQAAALLRLSNAYKDFILNGDDETLRAIAVHALPKVQRRIADLRRS